MNTDEQLTEREQHILVMVSQGLTNRAIAAELALSLGTVKWYCSQIYSKLGVSNRAEAVTKAHELRLIRTHERGSSDQEEVLQDIKQTIRIMTSFDGTKIAYAISGEGPPFIEVAHYLSHLELAWDSPIYRHLLREFMRTMIRSDNFNFPSVPIAVFVRFGSRLRHIN